MRHTLNPCGCNDSGFKITTDDIGYTGVTTDCIPMMAGENLTAILYKIDAILCETGPGSGVQSVIAGPGIAVDNSDPQNPIISAVGGGGGVESVTGTLVVGTPENPIIDIPTDDQIVTQIITTTGGTSIPIPLSTAMTSYGTRIYDLEQAGGSVPGLDAVTGVNSSTGSNAIMVTGNSLTSPPSEGILISTASPAIARYSGGSAVATIVLNDGLISIGSGGTTLTMLPQVTPGSAGATFNTRLSISPGLNQDDAATLGQLQAAAVTNLGYINSPTNGVVTSSTGTDATILAATSTLAGLMLPAEKTKLAGLESSHFKGEFVSLAALQAAYPTAEVGDYANVDTGPGTDVVRYIWDSDGSAWVLQAGTSTGPTAAEVKTLYESNPDTNAFTDTDVTTLETALQPGDVDLQAATDAGNITNHSLQIGPNLQVNGAAGIASVSLRGAQTRFMVGSTSDTDGGNFFVDRFNDSGVSLGPVMSIDRVTGNTAFESLVSATNYQVAEVIDSGTVIDFLAGNKIESIAANTTFTFANSANGMGVQVKVINTSAAIVTATFTGADMVGATGEIAASSYAIFSFMSFGGVITGVQIPSESGGTGSVQSVTGTLVTGTADNPVINFPAADQITNNVGGAYVVGRTSGTAGGPSRAVPIGQTTSTGSTIAQRTTGGQLVVSDAIDPNHAVAFGQLPVVTPTSVVNAAAGAYVVGRTSATGGDPSLAIPLSGTPTANSVVIRSGLGNINANNYVTTVQTQTGTNIDFTMSGLKAVNLSVNTTYTFSSMSPGLGGKIEITNTGASTITMTFTAVNLGGVDLDIIAGGIAVFGFTQFGGTLTGYRLK